MPSLQEHRELFKPSRVKKGGKHGTQRKAKPGGLLEQTQKKALNLPLVLSRTPSVPTSGLKGLVDPRSVSSTTIAQRPLHKTYSWGDMVRRIMPQTTAPGKMRGYRLGIIGRAPWAPPNPKDATAKRFYRHDPERNETTYLVTTYSRTGGLKALSKVPRTTREEWVPEKELNKATFCKYCLWADHIYREYKNLLEMEVSHWIGTKGCKHYKNYHKEMQRQRDEARPLREHHQSLQANKMRGKVVQLVEAPFVCINPKCKHSKPEHGFAHALEREQHYTAGNECTKVYNAQVRDKVEQHNGPVRFICDCKPKGHDPLTFDSLLRLREHMVSTKCVPASSRPPSPSGSPSLSGTGSSGSSKKLHWYDRYSWQRKIPKEEAALSNADPLWEDPIKGFPDHLYENEKYGFFHDGIAEGLTVQLRTATKISDATSYTHHSHENSQSLQGFDLDDEKAHEAPPGPRQPARVVTGPAPPKRSLEKLARTKRRPPGVQAGLLTLDFTQDGVDDYRIELDQHEEQKDESTSNLDAPPPAARGRADSTTSIRLRKDSLAKGHPSERLFPATDGEVVSLSKAYVEASPDSDMVAEAPTPATKPQLPARDSLLLPADPMSIPSSSPTSVTSSKAAKEFKQSRGDSKKSNAYSYEVDMDYDINQSVPSLNSNLAMTPLKLAAPRERHQARTLLDEDEKSIEFPQLNDGRSSGRSSVEPILLYTDSGAAPMPSIPNSPANCEPSRAIVHPPEDAPLVGGIEAQVKRTDSWLKELDYRVPSTVLDLIRAALQHFSNFDVQKLPPYYNLSAAHSRVQAPEELAVQGTISVRHKKGAQEVPVVLWLDPEFPRTDPVVYVTPHADLEIATKHKYIDRYGRVHMPHQWSSDEKDRTIVSLLRYVQQMLSKQPPLVPKTKKSRATVVHEVGNHVLVPSADGQDALSGKVTQVHKDYCEVEMDGLKHTVKIGKMYLGASGKNKKGCQCSISCFW